MVFPYYQSIKIFISSPGDVQEERNSAEEVIIALDKILRETLGLRVECMRWEDLPPLMPRPSEGKIQDVILRELVQRCDVFILILFRRYGSTSQGHDKSNTEREVETALDLIKEGRSISFLSYFGEVPPNRDPGIQEQKVLDLRKRLEGRGLFYRSFTDPSDFHFKLINDLYYLMLKLKLSTLKQRSLRCFWRLGVVEGKSHPELAIIYPPVDRSFMVEERTEGMWIRRLAPHLVFEDHKCINKLDRTLRLIGHDDISTYSAYNFPQEINDINRVWLCLPRNRAAQKQFRLYKDVARFDFISRKRSTEARFVWKPEPGSSEKIVIKSPLSKYLKEQREHAPEGEWQHEHGRIYAKDYAIVARFMDSRGRKPIVFGSLKDYFIAGIRGLGTWGAGWFIDRKYEEFLKYENRDNESIQLLLEVIYKNERIEDVRDVSDKPASYFANEFKIRTVRKNISDNI